MTVKLNKSWTMKINSSTVENLRALWGLLDFFELYWSLSIIKYEEFK